ncbi:unnamed protein product [marine sediment metagenome]|uniref:Uncharacterized protein n=1 Tax=marine sediment metagenome TaxID=412755 RepID=X1AVY3_9ZZZZ
MVIGNKVDNRNNLSDPSPMSGIYVRDVAGTDAVGKVSGNLVDGSNSIADPLYEFNVNSAGALVMVSDNVISDFSGVAQVVNVQITGGKAITKNYAAAGPAKGKLGYAPNTVTRRVLEKRPFGTLCSENIADEALQDLIYHQQDELQFSGVLLNRNNPGVEFIVSGTSALDITVTGGNYYCRGRRLSAAGDTVSLTDNVTNLVWLDPEGNYAAIDVTTDYSGDMQEAMAYVLGSATYVPDVDDDTHSTDNLDPPERGILLYLVETAVVR